jgi:hypothetical protein
MLAVTIAADAAHSAHGAVIPRLLSLATKGLLRWYLAEGCHPSEMEPSDNVWCAAMHVDLTNNIYGTIALCQKRTYG